MVDIFVSKELEDGTVVELNMIGNSVIRIEGDCNDQGSLCSRFWNAGLHVLGDEDKIRLWIQANAASGNGGASIQIEAGWIARKLDVKRYCTVQKVWLDGVDTCILLSDLICGLMDQDRGDVFDFANALVRC